jgi:hypothetical protein
LVGNAVLAKDVTLDYSCLGGFGDVTYAGGKGGVSVVDVTILGQKADQTLYSYQLSMNYSCMRD